MSEKKKGFFGEFKEFISKGNVMDLAVGIIIGSAFTQIVNSMVNNIIYPVVNFVLGLIPGGSDMANLKVVLRPAETAADGTTAIEEIAIKYGAFLNSIINFLIIAFVVFILVKSVNKMRAAAEAIHKNNTKKPE